MNEDFSDIINKFSSILKEKDIDLNKIVGESSSPTDFDGNFENKKEESNFKDSDSSNNFDFNLDIDTILKIKDILSKLNKNSHCPRNNLLLALKPYLENDKKEKLEQYIKIANLLSVLENFDTQFKPKFTESNYDFVLILTLFLLLF